MNYTEFSLESAIKMWPGLRVQECQAGPCFILDEATSSLDVGHDLAKQGLLPYWGSVLVGRQTAGRGQLRREWHSPVGNIYAAVRLPSEGVWQSLAAAPAFGGLLAYALGEIGYRVYLRWPNDILICQQRQWLKVAGVLLEERGPCLLAGLGINLVSAPNKETLRPGHAFGAGRLFIQDKGSNNEGVQGGGEQVANFWVRLVEKLFLSYCSLSQQGDANCQQQWWQELCRQALAFQGQRVVMQAGSAARHREKDRAGTNQAPMVLGECKAESTGSAELVDSWRCEGFVEGIDAEGALILRSATGMRFFMEGELFPINI